MHIAQSVAASSALVVGVENDFDFLSAEYATLHGQSEATAFQSPLWLHTLYTVLAPKVGAKPHIITARTPQGKLVMLIPLLVQRSFEVRILQPADLGVSDYNAIVADVDTMKSLSQDTDFVARLRKQLKAGDLVIFRKIQNCAELVAGLLGDGTRSRNENDGNEITLSSAGFEDWKKVKLSKKFRTNTEKRLRALRDHFKSVEFVTFTDPQKIEEAIRYIASYRCTRFKDDVLGRPAYVDFYLSQALAGAATGEAVTSGMIVDGVLVSANFGIVSRGAYHALLSATQIEEYRDYAPGLQAMLGIVRQRHEAGEKRFDFGMGNSRYKKDFAASEIPLYNLTVARTPSGKLVSLVYNRAKPLKTALRRAFGKFR